MKIKATFILLAFIGLVSAGTMNVYCGRQLSAALDMVCSKLSQDQSNSLEAPQPLIEPSKTLGSRVRRDLVSECCTQPCALKELEAFCS
uniref:Bombyxin A-1-like protein n=1 Tax=Pararge aegeria TaxID=116150 RepID=S4PED2_9NEOP